MSSWSGIIVNSVFTSRTYILTFDGVQAKVYHTPGHNPSCLTYEVGDYLFTGDAYIPGVKVVTTLKGGDKAKAAESVERILRLAEGKTVCAGKERIFSYAFLL